MNAERKRRVVWRLAAGLAGTALLLASGLWGAERMARRADADLRAGLLDHAVAIARALDPEMVRALSFSPADVQNPAYLRLCSHLRAYAEAAGLRSVYTMAMREGKFVFGPESLSANDPFASPPGTVFEQPSPADFEHFRTGQPLAVGPQKDEYGTFVSALAPVFDPRTGGELMAVGIDMEARDWQGILRRARLRTLYATAGLLVLLWASLLLLDWRDRGRARSPDWLRHVEVLLVLVLGSVLTLALAGYAHRADKRTQRKAFRDVAGAHGARIAEELRDLRTQLQACAGFMAASENVTREEFASFAEPLALGSLAQGWAWVVPVPAVAPAAGAGIPSTWQRDAAGERVPAADRAVLYPVLYAAPAALEGALGFDLGSEPARRAALEETLRTGLPAATDSIRLVAPDDQPPGILAFQAAASRRQSGLVVAVVRLEDLISLAFRRTGETSTDIIHSLFQLEPGRPPRFLATSRPGHVPDAGCWQEGDGDDFAVVLPLFLFGKTYGLVIHTAPEWPRNHPARAGGIVGAAGFLLTALLAAFVGVLTRHRAALEAEVRAQTQALREKSEELERFFSGTLDLLCIADAQGKFRRLNREWESTLGYELAELEGRAFMDLVHPDDREATLQAVSSLAKGQEMLNFINRYRCKDGSYRWIEWRSFPAGGMIYAAARDITDRRRAEQQLVGQLYELRQWQKAMLGREERIMELKREINDLLIRAGHPSRYEGGRPAGAGGAGGEGSA